MNITLAVIYYSVTGTNYQLAQWAAEGQENRCRSKNCKSAGISTGKCYSFQSCMEVHTEATKDVPLASLSDLEWAEAIIFSVPTRYGNMAAPMKWFLDSTGGLWVQGKLANKVVSAMTSAQNPHGGQEATILSLYTMMYHWGAIVAAPGYTHDAIFGAGGNPYGASATAGREGIKNDVREAAIHQGERTATIAKWLKTGMQQP